MKQRIWWQWVLVSLTLMAFGGVALAEEEEDRVVIRSVGKCPEIKILGGSGQPVEWTGRSKRGFLGVELTTLTPELRQHFGVSADAGVMVGKVIEESAAASAGFLVGDIITRVDGEPITSGSDLGRAVRQKDGGQTVEIEYWRDGHPATTTVVLDEQERCALDLGQLHGLDLERIGQVGWEISGEALEKLQAVDWTEALEGLKGIDWEKQLEGFKVLDVEGFEERMDQVRERLQHLEKSLEREQERLERLERGREEAEEDQGSDV